MCTAMLDGDNIARTLWKKLTGYHKRFLVKTAMYRIKQLFGGRLREVNVWNVNTESRMLNVLPLIECLDLLCQRGIG